VSIPTILNVNAAVLAIEAESKEPADTPEVVLPVVEAVVEFDGDEEIEEDEQTPDLNVAVFVFDSAKPVDEE